MRLLITGAGGFIGKHVLACAQAAGHEVFYWGRRALPPRQLPEGVRRLEFSLPEVDPAGKVAASPEGLSGIDCVIHLAGLYPGSGPGGREPLALFEANTRLTAQLLDACARAEVGRFLLASTASVYGRQKGQEEGLSDRLPEHRPLNARSPYPASKIAAEALVRCYAADGSLNASSLRLFNVYGPGQPEANVVSVLCRQVVGSGPVRLIDDRPVRDFIYAEDAARALLAAAECKHPLPDAINIGSGQGVSIGDLGRLAMELAGRSDGILADNESSLDSITGFVAGTELAEKVLGWRPRVPLREGLEQTLDYHRSGRETENRGKRVEHD